MAKKLVSIGHTWGIGADFGCDGSTCHAVVLTTYSRKWLTDTVYKTKGVSPYVGWLRFNESSIGVG